VYVTARDKIQCDVRFARLPRADLKGPSTYKTADMARQNCKKCKSSGVRDNTLTVTRTAAAQQRVAVALRSEIRPTAQTIAHKPPIHWQDDKENSTVARSSQVSSRDSIFITSS
jgi:hypothetical protein